MNKQQNNLYDLVIENKPFLHIKNVSFAEEDNWIVRYLSSQGKIKTLKELCKTKNGLDLSDKNNQALLLAIENNYIETALFLLKDNNVITKAKRSPKLMKKINLIIIKNKLDNFQLDL